ncbi:MULTISPECIES: M48 family metallopeptidase [unclassified Leptolyngbya]|uniref:M48 family metallopeptidase n=1 Tax=unclassified Leptolyngbya TaxID=2650499 RepID=UPI001685DAB9|nr:MULTISPECIES: M48 family metallopeptidase [unclassified Leptolyngbya]MBD1909687.1 M48 family metallopeptidase [Leptolyngbya sp. FACHB-8]MBD2157536.1 M48 family metallopeptidase [Leptolyngbya sp. FACHB-16]
MPSYPGISAAAFRHPLDSQAEQALRSVPGFDLVARRFVEFTFDRPRFVYLMGNSIEVGPRQYSTIYQIFRECLRDLDISPEPVLFVSQSPMVNAYAIGQERPSVVLSTGLLEISGSQELRAVIAHELGHLKCGHNTLTQMASWAITVASGLAEMTFGLSTLVSTGMILAFYEWLRKAELSADRAALLVMDDLNPVLQNMMHLAGGSNRYANELNLQEFMRQSQRYQDLDQDGLNQVYKFFLYNNLSQNVFQTHPFTVERVSFLQEWANSEEFRQIRAGNYRRGTQGAVDVEPAPPSTSNTSDDVERLRRELADLQAEIDRIKRSRPNS